MSRAASMMTVTPAPWAVPRARTVPGFWGTGTMVTREGAPARYDWMCGSRTEGASATDWKFGAAWATFEACQTGSDGAKARAVAAT